MLNFLTDGRSKTQTITSVSSGGFTFSGLPEGPSEVDVAEGPDLRVVHPRVTVPPRFAVRVPRVVVVTGEVESLHAGPALEVEPLLVGVTPRVTKPLVVYVGGLVSGRT